MNLSAIVKLEYLKLKSNYNYVLIIILAVLSFLVVSTLFYMTISVNGQDGGALLPMDGRLKSVYNRLGQLSTFIIALLAILNIGAEYKHLSFKRNIMDGMTRNQLFLSKVIGLFMLILMAILIMILTIVVVGAGMQEMAMGDLISNLFSFNLVRMLVKLIFAAGFGLFFITLFRTSSFAMIALIGYLVFEMIVGLLEKLRFQTDYAGYLPHNFVTDTIALPELSITQALLIALYISAFFVLPWIIFKRRDL